VPAVVAPAGERRNNAAMPSQLASIVAGALAVVTTGALAACNEGQQGANGRIEFTPLDCGNLLLGCSFDRSLALWADVDVQIAGIDGFSSAGLDLASADPSVLVVQPIADEAGRPTWGLHGAGEGVARLAAIDAGGNEVDFTEIAVRAAERLTLTRVLGEAIGPTIEGGAQTWTVNAEQPVSFQARMLVDESAELIGRMEYTVTVPVGSRLLDAEIAGSDRANGYLYVEPAAGSYPFSFELAAAPAVKVDAVIKAQ
jgi:hypothetical protein